LYFIASHPLGPGYESRMMKLDRTQSPPWTIHFGPPTMRTDGAVVGSSNTLFVLGGFAWFQAMQGLAVAAVHSYDSAKDAWTTLESASTPRGAAAAAIIGDKIYLIGGGSTVPGGRVPLAAVEEATCIP
jgi:hypothetical protein